MATYPIVPIDDTTPKAPLPAAILLPRDGLVIVRHYWGNSARPDYNRLWITAPTRAAREVTTGDRAEAWPGDEVSFEGIAGEELVISLNGQSGGAGSAANTGPTRDNKTNNARVHSITDYPRDPVAWARYVEWEDLNLLPDGSNGHYNDSRTLVYYPAGGWKIGRL